MRVIALLILMVSIVACRERSLAGTSYCTNMDLVGNCYYFKTDSTFETRGWSCMTGDTGVGHYQLTKDSLILWYDSLDMMKGAIMSADSAGCQGDTCVFTVQCLNNSEGLPFAVVTGRNSAGWNTAGSVTAMNGVATLHIANTDFPVTIECRLTGLVPVRITFNSPADYNVKVKMSSSIFVIRAGSRHAYAVKKISKKEIRLKREYIGLDSARHSTTDYLYRSQ